MSSAYLSVGLAAVLTFAGWISLSGQTKSPTSVWDGIYTEQQAVRGGASYKEACASCHGENLDGRDENPPLRGREFTSNWDGMSVGDLFEKIQALMPADRPGQLSRDKNAEILAYLLRTNKFPTGDRELSASDALKAIRFVAVKPTK
jgi:cytochrome c